MQLKEIKKGEMFKRIINGKETKAVYIKGDYDRATKTYCCYKYEDINAETFLKASAKITTDFIY